MKITNLAIFKQLLESSPFSERELVMLILTAPNRYKDHYIDKRNGRGKRLISQPTAELKFMQRLVIKELQSLELHSSAVAYRQGHSIKDHAAPHANSRYLLKLDFKAFFPSIKESAITYRLSRDTDYSEIEIKFLCRLLCRKPKESKELCLSIGAPSSPFVANYVMREFDSYASEICTRHQAIYTRYADDLAISTSTPKALDIINNELHQLLGQLSYLGLEFNEEKTINVSKKNRRTLVGLTLSNDGIASVGREKKRQLRAGVHSLVNGKLDAEDIATLKGYLAFALSIDPKFVKSLCSKYGFNSVDEIHIRK